MYKKFTIAHNLWPANIVCISIFISWNMKRCLIILYSRLFSTRCTKDPEAPEGGCSIHDDIKFTTETLACHYFISSVTAHHIFSMI